jgi:Ser/Thr protein kinase RdoA (MazF antagonist)
VSVDERPLSGGRITDGVVRVGDTVRRPKSAASPFVARLLHHLAAQGFDECPRFLGSDERGRDVFTFVPGAVVARWQHFPDDVLMNAAAMLRRFHDAGRNLTGTVVCHHDPGPNNVIFRGGRPVAFIDFDYAAPGDPLEDVAYMAWSWCISSKPERGPVTAQARQVRVIADAYGLDHAERLAGAVCERMRANVTFWHVRRNTAPRAAEMIAWTRAELAYVIANRTAFRGALAR